MKEKASASVLLGRGRAAREAGDVVTAIATFREAMRSSPDDPEPAFLLCASLLQTADRQAHRLLQHLLATFPNAAAGWEELGVTLTKAGQRDAALVCFTRAAATAPSFSLAMRRGLVLRELNRWQDAAQAFAEACKRNPRSDRAWFLLGLCAQDGKDLAGAREAYRRALAANPALAEAAVNLGTVLQDMGDLTGAKAAYGSALRARGDTFSRVAQAMTASPKGELWLDLGRLRRDLVG